MFMPNPITAFDFYKADHRRQYPDGTDMVYSNFTPRSDRLAKVIREQFDGKIVYAGLQAFLIEFLIIQFAEKFFNLPEEKAVKQFTRRMVTSLGPNNIGEDHIRALHRLGHIPLEIRALPEGSRVNMKVPVFTVKNTLPEFFWLTNAMETVLSMFTWKTCTSATLAYEYRKLLDAYAEKTGTAKEFVQWQGHDFSMRGMSGFDDAMMSGFGHLLSFTGTDTIPAIDFAEQYYLADADMELIGGSVAATEHSVMCMGMADGEEETFRRLIEDVYPSGIVSIVSDTWDFWKVMTELAPKLKDKIMARDGKVVFRPDSGNPVEILCGIEIPTAKNVEDAAYRLVSSICEETPHGECGPMDAEAIYLIDGQTHLISVEIEWNRHDKQYYYEDGWEVVSSNVVELTAEQKGAVQCLYETFGGTITDKGYKLLDSHVGLIYGDSITLERAHSILSRLADKGFASGNVVFGIGSYTYEYQTRDTFGFAMKATAGSVNGEVREIFKDPATGDGMKKSAKGFLRVEKQGNDFILYDQQTEEQANTGALELVFRDGKMMKRQSLAEIREVLGALV